MAIKSEQAVPANEIVVYKPNGRNGNCRGFLGSLKKKREHAGEAQWFHGRGACLHHQQQRHLSQGVNAEK